MLTDPEEEPLAWPSAGPARPWMRYFARMVDLLVFMALIVFVIGILDLPISEEPGLLFTLGLGFVYLFVEAAMLASWSSTPGKE